MINDIGGNEVRDQLFAKWPDAEEVGGAINATVNGKRITLARLEADGKYHMTLLGSFWEEKTLDVVPIVLGADEPEVELKAELNDVVEVTATAEPKPKRGVRRPKVDALEI